MNDIKYVEPYPSPIHGARVPQWGRASSLSRLHDHIDTRHSVGLLWTSDRPNGTAST